MADREANLEARKAGKMHGKTLGMTLLALALLAAGLAGMGAGWAAWPRTSNTSPLAALVAFLWSCTFLMAGVLAWRGSRWAAAAFLAPMGLLLPVFFFLFPGGRGVHIASFASTCVLALLGYRYLNRARELTQ